ncbi:hypothetical protein K2W90_06160 [Candidatus Babeliales bacterium]|nr:hypothetical protein [Candidatus Babeliales bacterium]
MKLSRIIAVVALCATLTTNHVHGTSSTTLAVGAIILSLPFAQALEWYNQFMKDTLHANNTQVLTMCNDLEEREFASDLLPEEAKDLCALNLAKNMNHNELVQAYEETYKKGLKKYTSAVKQHEKALKKGKAQETSPQPHFEDFCQTTYNKALNQLRNYHAINPFFPAKNKTHTETTKTKNNTQEVFPTFYAFINTEISRINKGKKNAEITKEKSAKFDKWVKNQYKLNREKHDYAQCKDILSFDPNKNTHPVMLCGADKKVIEDVQKDCIQRVCPNLDKHCPPSDLNWSKDCKRLAKTCKKGKVDLRHEDNDCVIV